MQTIRCLLIVPFPESALNEEAGRLFMDSFDEFCKQAKICTQVHAMPAQADVKEEKGMILEEK